MARERTIHVSLTPRQLKRVRERVDSGQYASPGEVIREGLRLLFGRDQGPARPPRVDRRLAAGYKAAAAHDRKAARDWAQLPEAWPEE